MSKPETRIALSIATAIAALTLSNGAFAQMAPESPTTASAPEKEVPAPNVDTNADGKPDAWDTDGDGKPDAWDKDGDGKPDAKGAKTKPDAKPDR